MESAEKVVHRVPIGNPAPPPTSTSSPGQVEIRLPSSLGEPLQHQLQVSHSFGAQIEFERRDRIVLVIVCHK